jgi:hypothetical protein
MNPSWKTPVALLIAVVALYAASLRINVHRSAEAAPQAPAASPSSSPSDGKPVSNEIPELQQLG